jgi:hypothetical protein
MTESCSFRDSLAEQVLKQQVRGEVDHYGKKNHHHAEVCERRHALLRLGGPTEYPV